jgi:hypothetical protein
MSKQSLITINPVWTRYAQGLQNRNYIATQVFPIISLDEADKAGKIPMLTRENFELSASKRAPHGKTPVINGNPVDQLVSYSCELDVLAYGIDITERKGKVIDMYKHATNVVTQKALLKREKAVADLVRNNALYTNGNTSTPTNKWSNTGTSAPLVDIQTAKGVIETNCGTSDGLKVIMGGKAWNSFKNHPDVLEMIKYAQVGVLTKALAASLLEVEEVIVGTAVYKNPTTGAMVDIWADDVVIFKSEPPAGQQTLYSHAFGYIPAVEGFDQGPGIDQFKSEDGLVEYMRAATWEDYLFHGNLLGYLLRDVNA